MNELPALPKRMADSHKGDYGRVVIVAGSTGMCGAAALAGMAALRAGSGLVTVATPEPCCDVVTGTCPALMTVGLPANSTGQLELDSAEGLLNRLPKFDVLAFGPGLGTSNSLKELSAELFRVCPTSLVLDADGLNNLPGDWMEIESKRARVLTPHPGEFRRISGQNDFETRQDMEAAADNLAASTCSTIVLKGHRTYLTDGKNSIHNTTGNSGMATGGSGDVLTGIVASLIGQKMPAFESSRLACHLHGLSGDLAAKELGEASVIATDLIDFLPYAMQQLG